MNTLTKVLIGAALVVGLAGLVVGLSNSAQIVNIAGNGANSLGAIASKWTNFAGSGVTTKVGYAVTATDDSGTTQIVQAVTSPAGGVTQYGVDNIPSAGSALVVLPIATTTALSGNFSCTHSIVEETTSTAAITLTLPVATSTEANCLPAVGEYNITKIYLAAGNSFNVTIATSTGDTFFYNGTSTPGALVLSTSTTGSLYTLESWDIVSSNSSTASVLYTLGYNGVGH